VEPKPDQSGQFSMWEMIRDNSGLLPAFAQTPHLGLAVVDRDMRYRVVNPALVDMTGIPAEARLGKTIREALGRVADAIEPSFHRVLSTGQPQWNLQVSATLPTKSITGTWNGNLFPIKDTSGLVKQVAMLVVDMTAEKRLQQKEFDLNRLETRCRQLESLLQFGTIPIPGSQDEELVPMISSLVKRFLDPKFATLALYDETIHRLRVYSLDSPLAEELLDEFVGADRVMAIRDAACGPAFLLGQTLVLHNNELVEKNLPLFKRLREEGIQSFCFLPLITSKGAFGGLNLGSSDPSRFDEQEVDLLKMLGLQIAGALDNAAAHREVAQLSKKLEQEKLYLQDEIKSAHNFEEIIGESGALNSVLEQAGTVAPSDATVLILGETGTGKELVARAIHRMSSRKDSTFIKMNCAAIPTGLLESELFGHEKGAFTGAVNQKIGRLELADKGTLFLDEVGEIPLELQPKLLRVLQDQEFERLGGNRTIKVSLRVIAATNRDLAKSVAANQFRSDLFYRLHVFPVRVPALRERAHDIPVLVRYFVQKFSRRMGKQIETIPTEAMDALTRWTWPGNVRELENFIERAVILSRGKTLIVPIAELRPAFEAAPHDYTLESMERQHILRVLRETGGVIAGVRGAAARLGMKRTTLQSRMQKLGITREDYQN